MLLEVPQRKIVRALLIKWHVETAGYRGCVCFSCGHASSALREAGLYVVDVSPTGDLLANRWWTPEEIHRAWPDLFDATSGHLPAYLMVRLAAAYRNILGTLTLPRYRVPTGSGETLLCLRWAYPKTEFVPVFDCGPGTTREPGAPLLPAFCEDLYADRDNS